LTIGQRAVQSTHAAINFCFEHRSRAGPWFENSNYLVQLSVSNEMELLKLIEKCEKMGITYTVFREPDLEDSITAIAIEPSPLTKKVVSHLPLLFKNLN
jgi:peptidyl-tRNA hydrolase